MSLHELESFFGLFLEASIAGSVLCIFLLGFKHAAAVSPQIKYYLWCVVLLRFALPIVPGSSWSISTLWTPNVGNALAITPSHIAPISLVAETSTLSAVAEPFPWKLTLWIVGAIGLAIYGLIRERLFLKRFVNKGKTYAGPLVKELNSLAAKVSVRTPHIIETNASPALIGIFRPRLLIPSELLDLENVEKFRSVAAHELGHLKRGDILWNRVANAILLIHWFNPLVWIAIREWRRERELVCDALALQILGDSRGEAYARTLLELAKENTPRFSGAVNVISKESELKRRITMITASSKMSKWATLVVAIVFGVAAGVLFTTVKAKEAPPVIDPAKQVETTTGGTNLSAAKAKVRAQQEAVTEAANRLQKMRQELNIPDELIRGSVTPHEEAFARYQSQLLDAEQDLHKFESLLEPLKKLDTKDGLEFLLIAWKDDQISKLISRRAEMEARLAELTHQFSSEHPDVKGAKISLDQAQKQLQERFSGIYRGLQINCDSLNSRIKEINKKLERLNAQRRDVSAAYEKIREADEQLLRAKAKLQAMEERLQELEISNLNQ